MHRVPLHVLAVDFPHVLVEGAQDPDVGFQVDPDVLDQVDQLLVLDVALQQSVDDLEQPAVHHQFQAAVVVLDVLENHEGNASQLFPRKLLEQLANQSDDAEAGHRDELLHRAGHERQQPDVEQRVVEDLDFVAPLSQVVDEELDPAVLEEDVGQHFMFVEVHEAAYQSEIPHLLFPALPALNYKNLRICINSSTRFFCSLKWVSFGSSPKISDSTRAAAS